MQGEEETFMINVDINTGREQLEMTVFGYEDLKEKPNHELVFKVILDGVDLTTVTNKGGESWYQVEGLLDRESIDKIGGAIEKHYL
ncbi:hypothetical protein HDC92_004297 [Pedobacter sp. AK017]|uniref:hypothetical protein n=1 Tax=Pedobacter sp. AK017 TaxID=2723073 RepID=UPI00160D83CA|nr:hypothetical protein [Pedobacter sp. AK017]MBB5440594.1 hypothetical protein [Pedobacter sp. AK017]